MKIGIDVMGGDNAPYEILYGIFDSLDAIEGNITCFGDSDIINKELEKHNIDKNRIEVISTTEVIDNHDKPARAIRKKPNSSMSIGYDYLTEGKIDVFISAGNTGVLLAGGTLKVGRIKGITRPAIGTVLPTNKTPVIMLDAGANVDIKPEVYKDFAIMGSIYMNSIMDIENPRVGLLNIGDEPEKGTQAVIEAFKLLDEDKDINFIGNVEARDVFFGKCDVLVTDGFAGNVLLKTAEGTAKLLMSSIKSAFLSSIKTKIAALLVKKEMLGVKKLLDYKEYGGAPFLGVNKPIIKAHGSSDRKAIMNSIIYSEKFINAGTIDKIKERMNNAKQ